ncbi:DNA repair protein RAD51 homolog 3 [Drosophila ananassae]|uniref:DNA repair protein RAD51 homolog 3 n=1 Tax=Drosophila ananassae TaxID=7217 RepID=UPI0013A5E746|nr:DNA repair protein RAD51 homolog 3 [Drosophila ananassae]
METPSGSLKNLNIFKTSVWDLMQEEPNKICTGIKGVDENYGGGISLGHITELIGNSGTGKTQMCLNLCLNVQIPKTAGGLEGSALFIDTRQDFNPHRLLQLATELERQYAHKVPDFKALKMLKNVYYVRCSSEAQLMASVLSCHRHLENHKNIKLIVIDSLSFTLQMIENKSKMFELLLELHESMRNLQRTYKVAWVITNVLTYRVSKGQFHLVPALGDLHSHLINERIWFSRSWQRYVGKTWDTCRLINSPK